MKSMMQTFLLVCGLSVAALMVSCGGVGADGTGPSGNDGNDGNAVNVGVATGITETTVTVGGVSYDRRSARRHRRFRQADRRR